MVQIQAEASGSSSQKRHFPGEPTRGRKGAPAPGTILDWEATRWCHVSLTRLHLRAGRNHSSRTGKCPRSSSSSPRRTCHQMSCRRRLPITTLPVPSLSPKASAVELEDAVGTSRYGNRQSLESPDSADREARAMISTWVLDLEEGFQVARSSTFLPSKGTSSWNLRIVL